MVASRVLPDFNFKTFFQRTKLTFKCPFSTISLSLNINRHYPVGVLYDLYGDEELPWTITVHFREFPATQLLRCPNIETIQSHFNNTLKEVFCSLHITNFILYQHLILVLCCVD
jgi:hypothetical protein